jgi:N-glycosylase/DNA lyase
LFFSGLFAIDDDLDEIFVSFPADSTLVRPGDSYPGLRVIRDPFFPCIVSFICSARTTVEQIHRFQTELAREFGNSIGVDGSIYYTYPRPAQLAATSEAQLRDLGFGFRAPYVKQTASRVASGELTEAMVRDEAYESAHGRLQSFTGVGPKVADCVALFTLGHLEAVPVDRWARRLVETYFPDLARETYGETADAFREHFGQYAGYAQTYLYHYERSEAAP